MKRKMLLAKLFACGMAALSVLAVLALLAGCTKELQSPGEDDPTGQGTVTRIGISAEGYVGDAGTKTSVKDKTVVWVSGDMVQLNSTSSTYAVTVNGENASINVTNLKQYSYLYAAYPTGVFVNNNTGMTFPSSYASSIDDGGRQVIALPMMAYADNSGNVVTTLEFKHQTAAVKVMLWNATPAPLTVTRVVVKTDENKLNGGLDLNQYKTVPTHEYAPVKTSTEAERQVEVTFPAYGESGALVLPVDDQSHSVQVPFRPIGADQMTIEVEATDGVRNITYSSKASNPALTRNKMMTARVKIDPSNASTTRSSVTLTSESGALTLYNGDIISGTGGADTHITIADGATVTLNKVTLTGILNNSSHKWAGLTCVGDAVIVLYGNTVNKIYGGYKDYPGIQPGPAGKTLTIRGTGELTVGSQGEAAIGPASSGSCGNIVIESGTVNANQNGGASTGIGAGQSTTCGDITITGGTVYASGRGTAPGIGADQHGTCGNILISGGSVWALGNSDAAGIGIGTLSTCGSITITDGASYVRSIRAVKATNYIGKGNPDGSGTCGTVTIDGVENPTPESTFTHFSSEISKFNNDNDTWTLTHK